MNCSSYRILIEHLKSQFSNFQFALQLIPSITIPRSIKDTPHSRSPLGSEWSWLDKLATLGVKKMKLLSNKPISYIARDIWEITRCTFDAPLTGRDKSVIGWWGREEPEENGVGRGEVKGELLTGAPRTVEAALRGKLPFG